MNCVSFPRTVICDSYEACSPTLSSMYCSVPIQFMVMNFSLTQMCLIFSVCIPAYNVSHYFKWQTVSFAWKCSWSPPNSKRKEPTGPCSSPDTESIAIYSGSTPSFVTFRRRSNLKVSTCVKPLLERLPAQSVWYRIAVHMNGALWD